MFEDQAIPVLVSLCSLSSKRADLLIAIRVIRPVEPRRVPLFPKRILVSIVKVWGIQTTIVCIALQEILTGKGVIRHLVCKYGPQKSCRPTTEKNTSTTDTVNSVSPRLTNELSIPGTIAATAGNLTLLLIRGHKTRNNRKPLVICDGRMTVLANNADTTTTKSNQFRPDVSEIRLLIHKSIRE